MDLGLLIWLHLASVPLPLAITPVQAGSRNKATVAKAALAHLVGDAVEQAYKLGDALEKRRNLMDAWANFCAGRAGDVVALRLEAPNSSLARTTSRRDRIPLRPDYAAARGRAADCLVRFEGWSLSL